MLQKERASADDWINYVNMHDQSQPERSCGPEYFFSTRSSETTVVKIKFLTRLKHSVSMLRFIGLCPLKLCTKLTEQE